MIKVVDKGWGERWPAPAKINLMLRIIGQREDGYHYLQTVFQLTDLCDWLTYHKADNGLVSLFSPVAGVSEGDELAVRAAKLLRQKTGCEAGVYIEIEKNLPMGGGLGGGSSDAATTLVVLNKLWGLDLSVECLMELGLQLGADVPVFVFGYAAWAEGVGEKLRKIDVPEKWLVIIRPDCHVDTKGVFSQKELTRDSESITMEKFAGDQCQNDCLDVVCNLYPPVKDAMGALGKYSEARLTGTGSCVFAQFDSRESAKKAFEALKLQWCVYLTKGLNRSPLLDKIAVF